MTANKYYREILGIMFLAVSTIVKANDPTPIPWPVGSTGGQMNNAKTLMASYGDPVNGWGTIHNGIDIDANTESVNGDYVRCVADGYVSLIQTNGAGNGWDILISPDLHDHTG